MVAMEEIILSPLEYHAADRLHQEFWLYAVFNCRSKNISLHTVQDPVRMHWQPSTAIERYSIDPDSIMGGAATPPIKLFTMYNGEPVSAQAQASDTE
jgi:hypothetical protein